MTFSEKLKQAMRDLNLNQSQVVGLTGKSKGSVSQYLSGKQIPPEETQSGIAISLGLDPGYFADTEKKEPVTIKVIPPKKVVKKLDVGAAARLMGMNHKTVRMGLQQRVFPWGYAIHTSEDRWTYFINAKRFAEIEGISLEGLA